MAKTINGDIMDKLELILAKVVEQNIARDGHVRNMWNSHELCNLINPSGFATLKMILERGKGLDRSVLTAPLVTASRSCDIKIVELLLEHGASYVGSQEGVNFIRDFLSIHNSFGHWRNRVALIGALLASNEATKKFVLQHCHYVDISDEKLVFLLIGAGADIYRGHPNIHTKAVRWSFRRDFVKKVVAAHQFVNPLFTTMLRRVDLTVSSPPVSGTVTPIIALASCPIDLVCEYDTPLVKQRLS